MMQYGFVMFLYIGLYVCWVGCILSQTAAIHFKLSNVWRNTILKTKIMLKLHIQFSFYLKFLEFSF